MSAQKISAGTNRVAGKGLLSAARPITFTYDGKSYNALEGDTLASALLANGIHLTGRSFKYHRPRGILTAGADEPNALMDIERSNAQRQPNVRATVQEVFDGMVTRSQNRWPWLEFDVGVINDKLSKFFPAGFYYKTFKWPRTAWDKIYEPIIRKAAGLGVSPSEPDPDKYANRYAHIDCLIIGGGAAGLAAALAALRAKKTVILCDENARLGGALLRDTTTTIDGKPAQQWVGAVIEELQQNEQVTILTRTTGFGYYTDNMVSLAERLTDHLSDPNANSPRERLWQVRATQVILATGAIERHLVFADNDRPGIMLASAAQAYLNQYGVTPGAKVTLYTACDSAYTTAFDFKRAGIDIPAIIDHRSEVSSDLLAQANDLKIRVLTRHDVTATSGRLRVSKITASPKNGGQPVHIETDCLLVSGGWTPSVHLFSQSRGKLKFDEDTGCFIPDEYTENCISVGSCNGTHDLAKTISEASSAAGKQIKADVENEISMAGHLIGESNSATKSARAFVDFQNDVQSKDIHLAVREGMHSIEHIKRYTTTGMASDQGKMSNMHALAIAAQALDKPIPKVGLTTFRQPYTPVTFGTIANHSRGALFDVVRRTPIHQWSEQHGAVFENVGNWKRPWYFPLAGEDMDEAVARECEITRKAAGIFDASTLGKIEVKGKDAVKFMNMMYTNPWDKLGIGRCRYGIMCREDGYVYDDGVIGRLSENHFHVTTTTGGAAGVLNMMEDYLQTEFPDWDVWLTSISEQWAVIGVQGPRAREIIEPLVDDIDLSADALPHMSIREGKICGVETRLMRVSFTGELGFEINVPANYGEAIWRRIFERGKEFGAVAYGTEAMHVMRAEKGFIIVGQDTDGTVTPYDAGVGWAVGKKKSDFVGIRGLQRSDLTAEGRKELVGLETKNPKYVLEEGAQIVADPNQAVPMEMVGHVTSSYWSPILGKSIALALVKDGRDKMGEKLFVPMLDETFEVTIVDPIFLDPKGERLQGDGR